MRGREKGRKSEGDWVGRKEEENREREGDEQEEEEGQSRILISGVCVCV